MVEEPGLTVEVLDDDHEKVSLALTEEQHLVPNDLSAGATARFLPRGYKLCQVTMNDELVDFSTPESEKLFRSTRFLEFSLDGISQHDTQDLSYVTGDYAQIMPVNDTSTVLDLCGILSLKPGQWVHIKVEDGPQFSQQVSTMRVGDLLSLELDLATQQNDGNLPLLERMLQIALHSDDTSAQSKTELARLEMITESIKEAGHLAQARADLIKITEEETTKSSNFDQVGGLGGVGMKEASMDIADDMRQGLLKASSMKSSRGFGRARARTMSCDGSESVVTPPSAALVREEGKKVAIAKIVEHYVTVPGLLKEFPVTSSKLSLADIVETLPRLKPRHYSIASSSEMYPTKLQLSVGKLTISHKSTGQKRKGVCSHFLASTVTAAGSSSDDSAMSSKDDVFCAKTRSFVRLGLSRSTFRLPDSFEKPLIMVRAGIKLY